MKRLLVLLLLFTLFATPVLAQEITPQPSGDPVVEVGTEVEVQPDAPPTDIGGEEPAPPNVDEAVDNLLRVVFAAAIALFVDAPVTVIIVSILKRFSTLDFFTARTWATIVAVGLWALLTVAQLAGFEAQFTSLLKILETTLPQIAALFFALAGTGVAYKIALNSDAPILSYEKPVDRQ